MIGRIQATSLLVLSFIIPISSIIVHFNDSTITNIESTYTTLGSPPVANTNYSMVAINVQDFEGNCNSPLIRLSSTIQGNVVVFNDTALDSIYLHKCLPNNYGLAVLFTHWCQEAGAVGVISVARTTRNYNDRLTGFNDHVSIPFLLTTQQNIYWLADLSADIKFIEFEGLSKSEESTIIKLKYTYNILVLLDIILYGILIVLLLYIIVLDVRQPPEERKKNIYRYSLPIVCLFTCIFLFLMSVVDPMNFKLTPFPSYSMYLLGIGGNTIVGLLLLNVWIYATGLVDDQRNTKVRLFLKLIHALVGSEFILVAVVSGLWYIEGFATSLFYASCFAAIILLLGLIYFGRNMIQTRLGSRSSQTQSTQSAKVPLIPTFPDFSLWLTPTQLILTIISYSICTMIGIILLVFGGLGGVLESLIFTFSLGAAQSCSFLLLFFQMRMRRKAAGLPKEAELTTIKAPQTP